MNLDIINQIDKEFAKMEKVIMSELKRKALRDERMSVVALSVFVLSVSVCSFGVSLISQSYWLMVAIAVFIAFVLIVLWLDLKRIKSEIAKLK